MSGVFAIDLGKNCNNFPLRDYFYWTLVRINCNDPAGSYPSWFLDPTKKPPFVFGNEVFKIT
jgi:hypothetical protein